jgi:hypothetical protein
MSAPLRSGVQAAQQDAIFPHSSSRAPPRSAREPMLFRVLAGRRRAPRASPGPPVGCSRREQHDGSRRFDAVQPGRAPGAVRAPGKRQRAVRVPRPPGQLSRAARVRTDVACRGDGSAGYRPHSRPRQPATYLRDVSELRAPSRDRVRPRHTQPQWPRLSMDRRRRRGARTGSVLARSAARSSSRSSFSNTRPSNSGILH